MHIKLALVQAHLEWENVEKNLANFNAVLSTIDLDTDIIVLPEVFSTGFTMNPDFFTKNMGESTFQWMKEKAKSLDKVIVGSVLVEEESKFYNRLFWIQPNGEFVYYDKRHLFQMGGEHLILTPGNRRVKAEYKGVNFMLQTCYDLRFPVFIRNRYDKETNQHDYDVLLYVANWPEIRAHAYSTLAKARAIENQAYVVWVNRIGEDGHHVVFSGDSQLISPYGKVTHKLASHEEGVLYASIDTRELNDFRANYKVGLDWD